MNEFGKFTEMMWDDLSTATGITKQELLAPVPEVDTGACAAGLIGTDFAGMHGIVNYRFVEHSWDNTPLTCGVDIAKEDGEVNVYFGGHGGGGKYEELKERIALATIRFPVIKSLDIAEPYTVVGFERRRMAQWKAERKGRRY